MRVIGTAGHVDHGKSTLVHALTGTHPDRLKEEREREMTIDLGFAWLTLPGGEETGIVDVPGHRDFIENMLAGVGGIDAALFVIAADEGVMPQTREHLAILDLLQIPAGVIALTKTDLAPDPDWIDLIEDEVRATLQGTLLAQAPLVRVSARLGQGIDELKHVLSTVLAGCPPRPDLGRPRLPVDRVFSMPGFGTVVTGTLTAGALRLGDEIELLPSGLRGRVRGLQSHKRKTDLAVPGARVAANLSGIDHAQVQRGEVVCRPGDYAPTRRLDVHFHLLPDVSQPLEHNTAVKFFTGAAEIFARLRLLGAEQLLPGESGWLQLELRDPVLAVRGDRYILRRPSPGETLGGGSVVDSAPKGRHKRFDQAVLARLTALQRGTPDEILHQALLALGIAPLREVCTRAGLAAPELQPAIDVLQASGQLLALDENPLLSPVSDTLVASLPAWRRLESLALETLAEFHRSQPLRQGMSREELRNRLRLVQRVSNTLLRRLAAAGQIEERATLVAVAGFQVQFSPHQQRQVSALLARFRAAPTTPPSVKESIAEVGEELYNAMVEQGALVQVSPEVVFTRQDYQSLRDRVVRLLEHSGAVTVAQVRDEFNASRKYVLALLEHLDASGVTLRDGDVRRLRLKPRQP